MSVWERQEQAIFTGQDKVKAGTPLSAQDKADWLAGAHHKATGVISLYPKIKCLLAESKMGIVSGMQLDADYIEDLQIKSATGLAALTGILRDIEAMQEGNMDDLPDADIAQTYRFYQDMYRLSYDLLFEVEEAIKSQETARSKSFWDQKPQDIKDPMSSALAHLHLCVRMHAKSYPELIASLENFNVRNLPAHQIAQDKIENYQAQVDSALDDVRALLKDIEVAKDNKDLTQEDIDGLNDSKDELRAQGLKLQMAKIKDLQAGNAARKKDLGEPEAKSLIDIFPPQNTAGRFDQMAAEVRAERAGQKKVKGKTPGTKLVLKQTSKSKRRGSAKAKTPATADSAQEKALVLTAEMQQAQQKPAKAPQKKNEQKPQKRFLGMKVPKFLS